MKQAHLIGDSHSLMYKSIEPEIMTYHFGACTAYSLMSEHSITGSFQKLQSFIKDHSIHKDSIIFGFGEIDCRMLIYFKHIKYKIDLVAMIDIVIYRYFSALSFVRDLGFCIAVHGPVPAVQQGNEYGLELYGDPKTRASINLKFNDRFRAKCHKEDIPYFDACSLSYLRGRDGLIPKGNLLPDLVHVDPNKVPIREDFKKWLKIWGILLEVS